MKRLITSITSGLCVFASAETSDNDGFKSGADNIIGIGARSLAAGWENTPLVGSIAVGLENSSHGYSIVGGANNIIDADSWKSLVVGNSNILTSSTSTLLLGDANDVSFENSTLVSGIENIAKYSTGKVGSGNLVAGISNTIDGEASTAPSILEGAIILGQLNQTSSSNSWVLGLGNIGQEGTVTLGQYASPTANSALLVGNGNGTTRSNALVVLSDGSVIVPSGNLMLGSDAALTEATALGLMDGRLETGGYLKRVQGGGSTIGGSALLALGIDAGALGIDAIALGEDSSAIADGSLAIGRFSGVGEYGIDSVSLTGGFTNAAYSFAAGGGQNYGTFGMAMMLGMSQTDSSVAIGGYDTENNNYPANVSAGQNSTTIGGVANKAEGFASVALGNWSRAKSAHSIAIGSLNRGDGTSATAWVDTDPLLELGNGYAPRSASEPISSVRSNAITTLKNGQTTLENKFWQSSEPMADPQEVDDKDSGGEALVVKGHTRLLGKVTIEEPQGDILLGVFGEAPPEQ